MKYSKITNSKLIMTSIVGFLWMTGTSLAQSGTLDQYQLEGDDQFRGIRLNQPTGQTFTVGISGTLSGIEISVSTGGGINLPDLIVQIVDVSGGLISPPILGQVNVQQVQLAVYPEFNPPPLFLSLNSVTGTLVDLSSLDIQVQAGDQLAFILRTDAVAPQVYAIRSDVFTDQYSGGVMLFWNSLGIYAYPNGDYAFKIFVLEDCSSSDVDGDGVGDVCDICPADPTDMCNPDGSAAGQIDDDTGGVITTPDDGLTIDIDPGDLADDTTISVTQTVVGDPEVDLTIGVNPGLGQSIAVYDLEPEGLVFDSPVTLTMTVDVTALNQNQRDRLAIYLFDEAQNKFVEVPGGTCVITEDPPGVFTAVCTAEIDHFSVYGLIAPLDSDNDGLPDLFGSVDEAAFGTDPNNPDSDGDGILDGTEVDTADGTGCPNPLLADSDSDTLGDGDEYVAGTDPCNADSDGDGFPDNIDPYPTEPDEVGDAIEQALRIMADILAQSDTELFNGSNTNANVGRRNSLSNRIRKAANSIAHGNNDSAIALLESVLGKLDGGNDDWLVDSPTKESLSGDLELLIILLLL